MNPNPLARAESVPSGGLGQSPGRAEGALPETAGAAGRAFALCSSASALLDAGHTTAAGSELRAALRELERFSTLPCDLPARVLDLIRALGSWLQTRSRVDQARVFLALSLVKPAELRELNSNQREQLCDSLARMLTLARGRGLL